MEMNYKATPEQWANVEQAYEPTEISPGVFVGDRNSTIAACILELRARVEALEANPKPTPNPSQIRSSLDLCAPDPFDVPRPNYPANPDSSLVERVAAAIADDGCAVDVWHAIARAAIREVAAALREVGS